MDGSTVQDLFFYIEPISTKSFFTKPFFTQPFVTKPLWCAVGLGLGDSVVCQLDGNDTLKSVPYLDISDAPSTCLPGDGTFQNLSHSFHTPFCVSLGISGEVPSDCIGDTIAVVLVTGSCQKPILRSEPVQIRGKVFKNLMSSLHN